MAGGAPDRPVSIHNLKPLPKEKHQLNKPQEYHPVGEPVKKKQYRPVVPRNFTSGYDTYLERRAAKDITDLSVFSLDEII